ncbi:hypothetical protein Trydic_g23404 [Trypoxylus dichotomus]
MGYQLLRKNGRSSDGKPTKNRCSKYFRGVVRETSYQDSDGETNDLLEKKKHERNVPLKRFDKSSITEHIHSDPNHRITFEDARASTKNYYNGLNMEAINTFKTSNNDNRGDELEQSNVRLRAEPLHAPGHHIGIYRIQKRERALRFSGGEELA